MAEARISGYAKKQGRPPAAGHPRRCRAARGRPPCRRPPRPPPPPAPAAATETAARFPRPPVRWRGVEEEGGGRHDGRSADGLQRVGQERLALPRRRPARGSSARLEVVSEAGRRGEGVRRPAVRVRRAPPPARSRTSPWPRVPAPVVAGAGQGDSPLRRVLWGQGCGRAVTTNS